MDPTPKDLRPRLRALAKGLARRRGQFKMYRDRYGLVAAALAMIAMVFQRIGLPIATKYLATGYDSSRLGIDTDGSVTQEDLDLEPKLRGTAVEYEPTPSFEFQSVLESLDLDYSRYALIDFGCGKGRVLLLGSAYPFREVVGVEASQQLSTIADSNVRRVSQSRQLACPEIRVVHTDAALYAPPAAPWVVFMFNPFTDPVFSTVLHNLEATLGQSPEPCYLLYKNPALADVVDGHSRFSRTAELLGGDWLVYEAT